MEASLQYWRSQLDGGQPADFLKDFKASTGSKSTIESLDLSFPENILPLLQTYCCTTASSLQDVLLAAFRATHYRHTGVTDATIGLVTGSNILCIRTYVDDASTIDDFINLTALTIQDAQRNHYQYRDLRRDLLETSSSDGREFHQLHTKLQFEAKKDDENSCFNGCEETASGADFDPQDIHLQLNLTETSDALLGSVSFASNEFHLATIRCIVSTFQDILKQIVSDPSCLVDCIPLPGGLVELDNLGLSQAPTSQYPRDDSIPILFKKQVSLHMNKIAVKDSTGASWTYGELDQISDRLALSLRQRALPAESFVGVLAPRSNQTIAALLAILKAGLAYLPLDVNAPEGRIADILALNSGRTLVLVGDGHSAPVVPAENAEFVLIKDLQTTVLDEDALKLDAEPSASSLAYVMYTSGTTGVPKGILIEHRGIVRLVKDTNIISPELASGVVAHLGNLVFDASTWEIFTALLNGGTLICIDYMTMLDIDALHKCFQEEAVQATLLTPAFLKQCLVVNEKLISNLDILLVGGDRFDAHDAIRTRSLLKPDAILLNACGPAENTVASVVFSMTSAEECVNGTPVGKSVTNSGVLVMDSQQNIVGPGVIGELVLTGDGLARGYTKAELNVGRFIDIVVNGVSTRAYRAGDRVRQRPRDGQMEFFGRLDHQIKIRGHRIELAEIDHALLNQPTVSDAVTLTKPKEHGGLELVSFVTTQAPPSASDEDSAAQDHVKNWGTVFDSSAYDGIETINLKDIGRDFVSWTSMYDGKLIDVAEMNEWLDDTIATINRDKPRNVLELGFGTGMILFNICDQIESYVGIDPSKSAVDFVNKTIKQRPDLADRVQVHCGAASDAAQFANINAPETVIINSVAQYFPHCEYLYDLVETLLKVESVQRIFFGDMRSYALYKEFLAERALRECDMIATKQHIQTRIAKLESVEEEFLVDPIFFTSLSEKLPGRIRHVEILPKRMETTNELSCYRYTAVIHTENSKCQPGTIRGKWIDFVDQKLDVQQLVQLLQGSYSDILAVSNIPNQQIMLAKHVAQILKLQDQHTDESIDWFKLEDSLPREVSGAMTALELEGVAKQCGYRLELSYARQHAIYGQFDAVFYKGDTRCHYQFPTESRQTGQKLSTSPVQQQQSHDSALKLQSTLRNTLPSYMVPTHIKILDSMPVNLSGKVDRKILARLALDIAPLTRLSNGNSAPKTDLEYFLCKELAQLLGVPVNVHDNFFELGGHSLIAMGLVSRINKKLNVQATVGDISSFPVVADLAEHIGNLVECDEYVAIPPLEYQGPVEQSFAQSRLFFLERLYPNSDWYLVPLTLRLKGILDIEALKQALMLIEERHESLRTVFKEHGGQCFQIILPFKQKSIEIVQVPNEAKLQQKLEQTQRKPFQIDTEPGWRVELYQLGDAEFILSTVMHHIISDGWSLEVLKREIATFYNAVCRDKDPLSVVTPLPVHYRDFTIWQRQPRQEAEYQKQLSYWKKILDGSQPATFLYDKERPAVPSGAARTQELFIDGELYQQLQAFCKTSQITPYVALLAAFRAAQFRLTGEADATIGTPAANRNRQELEGLIGFFVNMQCVRSYTDGQSFSSLTKQIMKCTTNALTNQDLPFERLVADLMQEGRDISRNPLVQIVFALHERQNQDDTHLDGLETKYMEPLHTTRFDLEFHVFHEKDRIRGSIVYAQDLLDNDTVAIIVQTFTTILEQGMKNPDMSIENIPLVNANVVEDKSGILIMDMAQHNVPLGVVGELIVTDKGVAEDYTRQDLDTTRSFTLQADGKPVKAYRTGHYARRRPTDGELEVIGPIRNGNNCRNNIMKLDETEIAGIEDVLRQYEHVSEASAVLRHVPAKNDLQLVAFITTHNEQHEHNPKGAHANQVVLQRPDQKVESHLYSLLRSKLPTHLLPTNIIVTNHLPKDTNNQPDRKALSEVVLEANVLSHLREKVSPKTPTETALCQYFAEVLGVTVGVEDNFFHLGGHSLLAVRLVSRINKKLDTDISVRDMFNFPVIAELAEHLDSRKSLTYVSIPSKKHDGPVEQSFAQGRLWFLDQLYPNSAWYLIPLAIRMRGALNVDALRSAIIAIEERHETLRTTFEDRDGVSVQIVHPHVAKLPDVLEMSNWEDVTKKLKHDHVQPFDLGKEAGWRVEILKLSDTDHVLSIVMHHIIGDGWSVDVLQKDIVAFYSAAVKGEKLQDAVRQLPIQYQDFSVWQREDAQFKQHEEQLKYWSNQLQDNQPAAFMCDKIRPKVLSGRAKSTTTSISGSIYSKLEEFCKTHQTTTFVVLFTVFRITHLRLSGSLDATIGVPIANRNRHELEDLIGFFVNLQCLRTKVDPDNTTFAELVQQVGNVSSQAAHNQDVPFERVVTEILPGYCDLSRNPLAQVAFAVHSQENLGKLPIDGLQTDLVNDETTTRFDLELHFFQETDGLKGLLVHSEELFFQETITSLLSIFEEVLEVCLGNPGVLVSTIFLERNLSSLNEFGLADFHQTKYPRDENIPALFRQQALISGDSIAITDSSNQLTYTQLNEYSDLLAQKLITRQMPAESLVATLVPRSCEAVVAFMGILKANLAYLPLDVNSPESRTSNILKELPEGAVVLLGSGVEPPKTEIGLNFTHIASLYSDTEELPNVTTWIEPKPTSLAYIMFSSGTTGKPKGITAEHRGVVRLVKNTNVASPSQASGIIAHMSNLAFDAATWEIYTALLNGGQVVCIDYMTVLDFPRLADVFLQRRITVSFITVALLRQILAHCPTILSNLDLVLSGGEKMPVNDAIQAQELVRGHFYNVYGPTENTSYSTLYRVPDNEIGVNGVPIGRSISHSGAFVMDSKQQLVPLGVMGELVVVGDGVSRGYTDKTLNAARFFSTTIGNQEVRAYRTGDLVRYRVSDGQLEFLGRMDNQVKIRGHRVELAEIEHVLQHHLDVADSAVISVKEEEYMELVGFVTLSSGDNVIDDDASGHSGQVENWTSLFDADVYANLQNIDLSDLGRDFTGWKSMYSKELIDKQEMSEWLDDTIATINMGGKPEEVLEIGSGTGMILFNLDTGLKSYLGLDPSAAAVSFTERMSKRLDSLQGRVQVKVGAGNEINSLYAGQKAEVAVINSVAQYFPSSGYLRALTEDLLQFDGMQRIFFGDIRSYALYQEFGVTKALYELEQTASKMDIRRELAQMESTEEELLVDPAFFTGLPELLPDLISHVEIIPKFMQATNELSCYRYAAVIHTVGSNRVIHDIAAESWIDFQIKGLTNQSLLGLLQSSSSDVIAVARIPYSKIELERAVLNSLNEETGSESWLEDLKNELDSLRSMSPFDINDIAHQAGYKAQVSWARQRTQHGAFDVVFHRMDDEYPLFGFPTDHGERSFRSYTSQPLQKRESDRIERDLRTFVQQALPAYMVPSQICVLDKMPLNANSKINRKELTAMSLSMVTDREPRDFVEPSNETQRLVCECFSAVLGDMPVGVTDNFFDIGGHSLLAMRLLAKINTKLGWILNVRDIYRRPTPQQLCDVGLVTESTNHFEIQTSKTESKATIVLIHAFMGQGGVFSDLRPLLPDCLDVIIVHDPFFARMDGPLTVKSVASLYMKGLKQILSVDKPVFLCGYSYGGLVALDMAAMWQDTFQTPLTSLIELDPGTYEVFKLTKNEMDEELEYGRHLFGTGNEEFTMRQLQKLGPLLASLETLPRYDGVGIYIPTPEAKERGAIEWWNKRFPQLDTKLVIAPHNFMIEQATVGEVADIFNEHILGVLNQDSA